MVSNNFRSQNFWVVYNFGVQKINWYNKILGSKKIWAQRIGSETNFWSETNFAFETNLGSETNFGSETNLGSEINFRAKKNCGSNFFWGVYNIFWV